DAWRTARQQSEGVRSALGGLLNLSALLQGKVGPVALRAQLNVFRVDLGISEPYWYDPMPDMLVPAHGFYLTSDTDLLYVSKFGLYAGVRYSLAHAFYDAPRTAPGFGNETSQHRI